LDAGVLNISPQSNTHQASDVDKVMVMIPLILEAHQRDKCIAVLLDPATVGIAISGLWWRGDPFIVPLLDDAIALARTLGCFKVHRLKDQDKPGQYYASHAEVQFFMYFLHKNNIVVNTNSDEDAVQVRKAFVCLTSLRCCNNCVIFFRRAADYYKDKVDIVINRSRFVGRW
jgi:hypothetical protein